MRLAVVLVLVASIGTRQAHADRGLEVMALVGVGDERPTSMINGPFHDTHTERSDTGDYDPYPARLLFQVTLGWEHDSRALPNLRPFPDKSDMHGSTYVSPELVIAALGRRALVQAGVRFEAATVFCSKPTGSARMWIAPRIGWLEGAATPVVGFDYTTLLAGSGRWGFGLVMGANFWRERELECRCLVEAKPRPATERRLTTYAEPYGGFSLSRRF